MQDACHSKNWGVAARPIRPIDPGRITPRRPPRGRPIGSQDGFQEWLSIAEVLAIGQQVPRPHGTFRLILLAGTTSRGIKNPVPITCSWLCEAPLVDEMATSSGIQRLFHSAFHDGLRHHRRDENRLSALQGPIFIPRPFPAPPLH
jgi:hypothetical protein